MSSKMSRREESGNNFFEYSTFVMWCHEMKKQWINKVLKTCNKWKNGDQKCLHNCWEGLNICRKLIAREWIAGSTGRIGEAKAFQRESVVLQHLVHGEKKGSYYLGYYYKRKIVFSELMNMFGNNSWFLQLALSSCDRGSKFLTEESSCVETELSVRVLEHHLNLSFFQMSSDELDRVAESSIKLDSASERKQNSRRISFTRRFCRRQVMGLMLFSW